MRVRGAKYLSLMVAALLLTVSATFAQTSKPAAEFENDAISHPTNGGGSANAPRTVGSPVTTSDNSLDFRRVALSLAIVLAIVFGIRWTMRWMFPTSSVARSSQVMRVLSRSVIAPKQQLLLIQVGRRLVMVGDTGGQMNALAEITDADEVASIVGQLRTQPERESAAIFAPMLGRAQEQFEEPSGGESTGEDAEKLDATQHQISGLTEKIRMLSQHLGKST